MQDLEVKCEMSVEVIMQMAITNFYNKKADVTVDMSIDLASPSEKDPVSLSSGDIALKALNDNEVSWAAFSSVANHVDSSSPPPRSCGICVFSESVASPPESSNKQTEFELESNGFSECVDGQEAKR